MIGTIITGIPLLPIQIGECMLEAKPITTIIRGAGAGVIHGAGVAAGMEDIILIGATAAAGASVFHGEAHGAGAAAGIWAGDTHHTGAITLIGAGADTTDILTGATADTGEEVIMLLTEEAV